MVAKALDIIRTDGPARGLFLNVDKTELFWPVEDPRSRVEGVFLINISRPLNGVKLLGGSVSLDEMFCRDLALKRVSKTISLMEAIYKLNDPHMQTSVLQDKILTKTGIVAFGSSFQQALDNFNNTCNIDALSATTGTSAPQMMKTLAKCYFCVIEKDLVSKYSLIPR